MKKHYTWLINLKVDLSLFLVFSILSYSICQLPIGAIDGRVFFISFSLMAVLFGYTHIFSTFVKVYGTNKFKNHNLLLLSPLIIFIAATVIHFLSINCFWLLFAGLSIHHTLTQQVGLIKITSNKEFKLPRILFTTTVFGLPLLGTLYLLSDPRGYKPALGWIPTLPYYLNTLILGFIFIILLIVIMCEIYYYKKTKIISAGKYLQYFISIICWIAVPILSKTLESTYACLTIAHGIYYISMIYYSSSGEFTLSKKYKKWSMIWFLTFTLFASFFIYNLLHGQWLSINKYTVAFAELALATISWSHYNFDAWIWKKKVRDE